MSCMKLGSKTDAFQRQGQAGIFLNSITSIFYLDLNVVLKLFGLNFWLYKMCSKCLAYYLLYLVENEQFDGWWGKKGRIGEEGGDSDWIF